MLDDVKLEIELLRPKVVVPLCDRYGSWSGMRNLYYLP